MFFNYNLVSSCEGSHHALRPPTPPSPVRDLGQGAVTSQAGFLNLRKMNITLAFLAINVEIWYTCHCLSFLIWFMLYNGQCASLMCPACDVTVWVREGQQYLGHGKGPHTEIYVARTSFSEKLKYILATLYSFENQYTITLP